MILNRVELTEKRHRIDFSKTTDLQSLIVDMDFIGNGAHAYRFDTPDNHKVLLTYMDGDYMNEHRIFLKDGKFYLDWVTAVMLGYSDVTEDVLIESEEVQKALWQVYDKSIDIDEIV